jgi:hypothetical protein
MPTTLQPANSRPGRTAGDQYKRDQFPSCEHTRATKEGVHIKKGIASFDTSRRKKQHSTAWPQCLVDQALYHSAEHAATNHSGPLAMLSQQTYHHQVTSPHRHNLITAFQPQFITHNCTTFKILMNNVTCVLLWLFSARNPTVSHNCKDFRHVIHLQYIQGFQTVTFCPTVICSCWEQPHILLQNEK